MPHFTVHYHELSLKRGNRRRFEGVLRRNIQRALADLGPCRAEPATGRLLVETDGDAEEAARRLTRVAGVAYILRVVRMPKDLDAIAAAVAADLEPRDLETFRITTRRVDKSYPLISQEVDREVGGRVAQQTGLKVKLKGMDAEVQLTVMPDEVFVGFDKRHGPGGLPAGTGGRVAVLMSGGIDSPVAAWRMINRGCRAELVHFHSHPLVDKTTQEKARDLAEKLAWWQGQTRLHLVPLAPIQTEIKLKCPEPMRVILYRRFMVRITERIARRRKCRALVTGESLGQVASQTLENLGTVDAATDYPVLRPLIGSDKQEIIELAEKLGTFEISIRKDQDCCSLFVPSRPATKSTAAQAELAEKELDVDTLVAAAVAASESMDFDA